MLASLATDSAVDFAVLAMDDLTENVVARAIPRAKVFRLDQVMEFEPRLEAALHDRTVAEQFFTIGPTFLAFCAESVKPVDWLVYADADLKFYRPLGEYLSKFEAFATVLIPHRHYWWNARRLERFGRFNVGMVPFNMKNSGSKLLTYWASACIDWCYDKPESGKYADQRYLERFEEVAPGHVAVDSSVGVNLAPWNSSLLSVNKSKQGVLQAGDSPIEFFHFQGLKYLNGKWHLGHLSYLSLANVSIRKYLYFPYLLELEKTRIRYGLPSHGSSRGASSILGRASAWLMPLVSVIFRQTIDLKS